MMNIRQRRAILVIALILLHLAAFTQDKKYVKKNLTWHSDSVINVSIQLPQQPTSPPVKPFMESVVAHQGFMCKKEYQLEKITRFPIKVRLGTYEESHRLEYGK
jgi:hypothetical protein